MEGTTNNFSFASLSSAVSAWLIVTILLVSLSLEMLLSVWDTLFLYS